MKILFLVSSMHGGGAERVAATLSGAWAQRGDQVTLAATFSGRGQCVYPLHPGVRMLWLADRMAGARLPLYRLWGKPLALRALIRESAPDVVVSFLTNVNVQVLLASRGLRVPVIVCERTHPQSGSAGRLLSLLRRLAYPRADLVVSQTEETRLALQAMVPSIVRSAVVPNPLPPALPAAKDWAVPPAAGARRRLLALGRLVPAKRFDWLIDAFAPLARQFPEWDLEILGEGPQRQALQDQAAALGLQSRIRLPGRTDAPWEALRAADAFALTSRVEGFPNAMLEAMALGLPCVAVDCPSGPAELSEAGRVALLCAPQDLHGFGDNLARVMADGALRRSLGESAAVSVRARYGQAAVLAQWDTLFAGLGITGNGERHARTD